MRGYYHMPGTVPNNGDAIKGRHSSALKVSSRWQCSLMGALRSLCSENILLLTWYVWYLCHVLISPPKKKKGKVFWMLCSKESACNEGDVGDTDLIPGSGRSPAVENGNPLQYSCLENPMDRGTWWATVHGMGSYLCYLGCPETKVFSVLLIPYPLGWSLHLLAKVGSYNHIHSQRNSGVWLGNEPMTSTLIP